MKHYIKDCLVGILFAMVNMLLLHLCYSLSTFLIFILPVITIPAYFTVKADRSWLYGFGVYITDVLLVLPLHFFYSGYSVFVPYCNCNSPDAGNRQLPCHLGSGYLFGQEAVHMDG